MYTHTNEQVREEIDKATRIAIDVLETVLSKEKWLSQVRKGYELHGTAFIAFLHLPVVRDLDADQLLEQYERAYILDDSGKETARENLLKLNGWDQIRQSANAKLGFEDLLQWDEDELQAAIEDRYELVVAYDRCVVFDHTAIETDSAS